MAANQKALTFSWTTKRLDILDGGLKYPLTLKNSSECKQLNLLVEAEDQVMREDEEVVAVDLLVDLFVCFVLHVIRILGRHAVDDDFLVELHGQSVFVDGDLLDVVSAPDLHSGLGNEVLDDHICHELSVGVSLLVEAVDLVHVHVMKLDGSVVSSSENGSVAGVD